ncbi:GNAT family N-acetyltransferase [Streptomyces sp. NBC_00006]|uniref:hypothetical protein n=1 Tax=unclassified Streptomyces TaxID=2593676 RepID=UPI002252CDB3|nr:MULTISPECIES: hypothetical protein [unclassified Streptomyces]MCX5533529.1 GNAT family N-acetyltransferase [Streptomyces sp. NBC_00006]
MGRLLFEHVRDTAREARFTRVSWAADPNAVPFYEAMGARHAGAIPSGSALGRMLPLMELRPQASSRGTART